MTTTPETPAVGGAAVAPPGARFDPATGAELSAGAGAGGERRQSYALQPGEPVASFNLVTSLMPLASGMRSTDLSLGTRGRNSDPGRRRRARLPGLRVRGGRGGRPRDLRRLHVRREPVGGQADRRGARRHRGRGRARRGVHLPLARRDPRQQHLVGELRRQRREWGALVEPAGPGAARPDRRRGAQGGRAVGPGASTGRSSTT